MASIAVGPTTPGPANFGVGSWIERRARIAVAELADTEPSVLIQHGTTDHAPVPSSIRHPDHRRGLD